MRTGLINRRLRTKHWIKSWFKIGFESSGEDGCKPWKDDGAFVLRCWWWKTSGKSFINKPKIAV